MKLIGYVRVSSTTQAENTSLESQRERIAAYCQAMGHELVGLYSEIGSGKAAKSRAEFNKAIDSLDNADGLIVVKLDRLARNCRDVLALVEDTLQPKNKVLVILDLNVDTSTPTGKMVLTMMAAVAELELTQIRERTENGKKDSMKKGQVMGAPKFGEKVTEPGKPREIDATEQETIAVMIRHRKQGKGYAAIANTLNKKKEKYPTKLGTKWYATSVKNVLDRLGVK